VNLCLACRDVHVGAAGGLARATRDLAGALACQGHEVHLLTDMSPGALPALDGVSVRRLLPPTTSAPLHAARPETAGHDLLHATAVYQEVRRIHEHERPVDAVLAPLWRSEGAVCVLDHEIPTIVSCMTSLRTLTEVDPSYAGKPAIRERLRLERESLARARYLHGLTESVLTKTIDDYGLHPVTTAVIGRGLHDRREAAPLDAGAEPGVRVLSVGRIEHRKGIDTLLAAARELVTEGVEISFTLAGPDGDPSIRRAFEEQAAMQPALRDAVRFLGAVSDRELARLYAEADLVCAPSRYESHGVVLIEAMMYGKAIVTCDAGGIGEVVQPGHQALLVTPGDSAELARCLRRLAADPELRSELGRAGRLTYERRFAASSVTSRMEAFIERVVAIEHRAAAGAAGVGQSLAGLLHDVLEIEREPAAELAAELLDPSTNGPRGRIRAAALASRLAVGRWEAGRVAAVIVTHDRPELLSRALDSLELEPEQEPIDVLVVANGCSDPVAREVATDCSRRLGVRLHSSGRNLGAAGGRRLGVELAAAELVLFLDDDAELMPGALAHLVAQLDEHPSAGAVTAAVVAPDGSVLHCGGTIEVSAELATFALSGVGVAVDSASVPPTGPTGWVPGTAVLIRRSLLTEFELDERMSAYYEDNEWCYRVVRDRPDAFRRCREALAIHHLERPQLGERTPEGAALTVRMLTAHARFYERHRRLLVPWLFDVVPELRTADGTRDQAAARLLLEIVTAKGADWTLSAWSDGALAAVLDGPRREQELRRTQAALHEAWADGAQWKAEIERLRAAIASREETLAFLQQRDATLCRIEQGGWWRLRDRLRPALRFYEAVRSAGRRQPASQRRSLAPIQAADAPRPEQAHEG
jgi:glycosyltransferase involved in cell wall biosynthesis/GT2 family glycosyltransferase